MPLAVGPGACDWVLRGARVAVGPEQAKPLDVIVRGGRISGVECPGSGSEDPLGGGSGSTEYAGQVLDLEGCLLLPGLVNAHDHLEFSLFPRLGRGPFPNAREWARAVYRPAESPVREQLQVPKRERLIWGGLKNLLSGVTTVCHHNPYEPEVFENSFPVRVVRRFGWAHSLDFSDDVAARFAATPPGEPFVVHLGEGTDEAGRQQVFELDAIGALDSRTVLVHGVALDGEGLELVERRGAAMVWCPSSNLFTLGATLDQAVFSRNIPVALATDSALTGVGDLLDEIRVAHGLGRAGASRLFEMVTGEAAAVLRLADGEGRLAAGGLADLVVIADPGGAPCEALAGEAIGGKGHAAEGHADSESADAGQGGPLIAPLLVMVGGAVKLVAEGFARRLDSGLIQGLRRIQVEGRGAFLVDADVPALVASARRGLGGLGAIRLAGRVVYE